MSPTIDRPQLSPVILVIRGGPGPWAHGWSNHHVIETWGSSSVIYSNLDYSCEIWSTSTVLLLLLCLSIYFGFNLLLCFQLGSSQRSIFHQIRSKNFPDFHHIYGIYSKYLTWCQIHGLLANKQQIKGTLGTRMSRSSNAIRFTWCVKHSTANTCQQFWLNFQGRLEYPFLQFVIAYCFVVLLWFVRNFESTNATTNAREAHSYRRYL